MTSEQPRQGSGDSEPSRSGEVVDTERVVRLLDELVRIIDDGALQASSPERSHLVGARDALRLYNSPSSS